ncbi:MAG: hypothetical protein OEO77_10330, partial [Acidimicrobiia bacterium]|nr:hypothetical protein [Acidimicrobiia bacterium]
MALVLNLVTAGIALADNLVADGDGLTPVSAITSLNLGNICVGQSKTASMFLVITRSGSGQVYANSAEVTVSAVAGAGIETSFADASIDLPANWVTSGNGTVSSDTAQTTVTVTAAGTPGSKSGNVVFTASGAMAAGTPRSVAVTFNWVVAVCDSTPPVITPNVSGTLGLYGWYTGDVTVSWTVVDNESAVTSTTGCGLTTIAIDTAGQTLTCSATSAGGPASNSVTIKRDATPPSVVFASAAGTAGNNGWYVSDVVATFTATDSVSGFAGPSSTTTGTASSSGESAALVISSPSFTDLAGNVAGVGAATH